MAQEIILNILNNLYQARIPEWVANPFSWELPDPGIELRSPELQAESMLSEPPWKSPREKNLKKYIYI